MTKKICIVGDPHVDNKQPTSRTDNYMDASLADLKCSLIIASKNNCDAIVFLGDMCSCSLQTIQEPGRTGSTGTSLNLA